MLLTEGTGTERLLERLRQGAFLVVRAPGAVNVMTVSCGLVGQAWMRPALAVMVRRSRHTHALLAAAEGFALCLPGEGRFEAELRFCGTHSGRAVDKPAACGLDLVDGEAAGTALVAGCAWNLVCRKLAGLPLPPGQPVAGLAAALDPDGDPHTFFVGELLRTLAAG